jgi:hypothetical protein
MRSRRADGPRAGAGPGDRLHRPREQPAELTPCSSGGAGPARGWPSPRRSGWWRACSCSTWRTSWSGPSARRAG